MSEVLANILDPIHDMLPPSVWSDPGSDQPKLKPQHKKWIQRHIRQALEDAGYSHVDEWLSLVLTGSLTTYQYSDESDCDVSLFVDTEIFPEWSRAEMIGVMVSKVDGTKLPGTTYPMQCFVVASGVTKESLYQPGLRSGYDLEADTWINPPERDRVHDIKAEENGMYVHALEQADKMERLLRYEPDKAVEFWHQIHTKRQRDQRAGKGDYALSNIVYKFLANRGLFPEISEASGEYIAKTAFEHRQVAKFVYDPVANRLVIGHMAAEEGEVESHNDLMRKAGIDPANGPLFGQVGSNGYVETFGRPMITGFGKPAMNQYEADWRLRKALAQALPEAQFTGGEQGLVNPRWEEMWTEPSIEFLGERPAINGDHQPQHHEEGVWSFT